MSDSDDDSSVESFDDASVDDEESSYDSEDPTDDDSGDELPGDNISSAADPADEDYSDVGDDFSADDAFEVSERDPSRVPCAVLGYASPPLILSGDISTNRADCFIAPRDPMDLAVADTPFEDATAPAASDFDAAPFIIEIRDYPRHFYNH